MNIAGIEIPDRLEFGNSEHIRLVRLAEKTLEMREKKISAEIEFEERVIYDFSVLFSCPSCGKKVSYSDECEEDDFNHQRIPCSCGARFQVLPDEESLVQVSVGRSLNQKSSNEPNLFELSTL